ncbi:hypothetical protein P691DRAFT_809703 [Macrolepiota fuliginosa MF-IS2]|uniref:Uncharacterized protein n=1 Tax=Macrolepiota fuliginosa MF-IS2 TaxID=1400762 RepID=A0A9P5XHW3_9AGAR|nr:hypothetical protein P691DRAFT_809703 [Macrolepiota fuliginosa MF-IS2]
MVVNLLQLHLENVGQRSFSLRLKVSGNVGDSHILKGLCDVICQVQVLIGPPQWMDQALFIRLEELGMVVGRHEDGSSEAGGII